MIYVDFTNGELDCLISFTSEGTSCYIFCCLLQNTGISRLLLIHYHYYCLALQIISKSTHMFLLSLPNTSDMEVLLHPHFLGSVI